MSEITWTPTIVKLGALVPWERNPRGMSKKAAARLLANWKDLGQWQTLAIGPGGEVYDGHQRLSALLRVYGREYEVQVLQASRALSDDERARIVFEGNTTAVGSLDFDLAVSFPAELLQSFGFDNDLLAEWNDQAANLRELLASEKPAPVEDVGAQVDKAEELREKWQVSAGDIFQAGEHFIICGDCRESETWARLLAAAGVEKVNGVFTSPPYAEQRKQQYGGVPTAEYVEWWEAVQANVRANLASDGSFFVNIKPHCEDGERVLYVFDLVLAMVRRWGWRFVDELCWRDTKDGVPGGWSNRFKNAFEPIYHFSTRGDIKFREENVRHKSDSVFDYSINNTKNPGSGLLGKAAKGRRTGMARASNVIEAASDSSCLGHVAPFPVALPTFFVKAYSDAGDVWLDPFLGSGTTIVAAHNEGRRGLGIERLEKYVAVTLERLAGLGLEPRRLG